MTLLDPKTRLRFWGGLYQFNPQGGTEYNNAVGFKQGTDCDQVQGCWITECYPSIFKYRVMFDGLQTPPGVTDAHHPAVNVRVVHGLYLNTLAKLEASTNGSAGTVLSQGLTAIKKELFNSAVSSDYLAFPERNRRIKILSDKVLKPGPLQYNADSETGTFQACPAPVTGRFAFPHNKMKQKLAKVGTPGDAGRNLVPYHSWIPFTVFMCDELGDDDDDYGSIKVDYSSKFYFRDT